MNCEDDLRTSRRVTSSTRKSPPRSQRTCWNLETGELVTSCTIIVTDANALTRQIHDRLPVMLDKANVRPWRSHHPVAGLPRALVHRAILLASAPRVFASTRGVRRVLWRYGEVSPQTPPPLRTAPSVGTPGQ